MVMQRSVSVFVFNNFRHPTVGIVRSIYQLILVFIHIDLERLHCMLVMWAN